MGLGEVWFRKYHRAERLTRSGLLFFLAITGIGAVAINSGNNLLYLVFSALLSALVYSGFLSVANLRHVEVELEAADDVIMNRPSRLVVRVHNGGSFPLFFTTVRMHDLSGAPVLGVTFVAARSTEELPVLLTMHRRGRVSGLWAELSSTFPFGIVEMRVEVRVGGELVVYPEVRPVVLQQQGERGEHRLEKARPEVTETSSRCGGIRKETMHAVSIGRFLHAGVNRTSQSGSEVSAGDTVLPGQSAFRLA